MNTRTYLLLAIFAAVAAFAYFVDSYQSWAQPAGQTVSRAAS